MYDAGSTTFNGALDLSGTGTGRTVNRRIVNLNGTTTWSNVGGVTNAGRINTYDGATLNNNGIWLDQLSADSAFFNNGAASTFNNVGSYVKSGAVTTDLSGVRFVNAGTTIVQRGISPCPPTSPTPAP